MNLPKTDDNDRTYKNDTNDTPSWHMVNANMDPFEKISKGFQPFTVFTKLSALCLTRFWKRLCFYFWKQLPKDKDNWQKVLCNELVLIGHLFSFLWVRLPTSRLKPQLDSSLQPQIFFITNLNCAFRKKETNFYLFIYLFIYLFVYLFIYLFIYSFIYLFVYLFILFKE